MKCRKAGRIHLVGLQEFTLHHSQAILQYLVGGGQPLDVQLLLLADLALGGGLVPRRPLALHRRLVLALQPHDEARRAVQLFRQLDLARPADAIKGLIVLMKSAYEEVLEIT